MDLTHKNTKKNKQKKLTNSPKNDVKKQHQHQTDRNRQYQNRSQSLRRNMETSSGMAARLYADHRTRRNPNNGTRIQSLPATAALYRSVFQKDPLLTQADTIVNHTIVDVLVFDFNKEPQFFIGNRTVHKDNPLNRHPRISERIKRLKPQCDRPFRH